VSPRLQGALAFNALTAPTASTPNLPYPHELMRVLWGTSGPGALLVVIGFLTMMAWVAIWWASLVPFAQRAVLAWSLDDLIPGRVSSVNPRYHTSLPSLLIACLMVEFFILAFAFFPSLRTIILLIPIYAMIGITMAVGVVFPFVRRGFFDQSMVGRSRILGLPTMTVACGLGTVVMAVWTWLLWIDPVAAGTDRRPIVIVFVLAAAVAVYYFALRAYRRRSGVDISATFRQIPIE
jgi:amino acid transporter